VQPEVWELILGYTEDFKTRQQARCVLEGRKNDKTLTGADPARKDETANKERGRRGEKRLSS
jgi:hypothetical protein